MTPKIQRLLAIGLLSFLASVIALAFFIANLGYPDQATLEAELQSRLPPGSQKFEVVHYDQDDGDLWIRLRCPTYGDPIGYEMEVHYHPDFSIRHVILTNIEVYRRQGWDRLTLAYYTFEDGVLRDVRFWMRARRRDRGWRSWRRNWMRRSEAPIDDSASGYSEVDRLANRPGPG